MSSGSGNGCNAKKNPKVKLDFDSLYDQLAEDNELLNTNKEFWTRKGNSQKYTCTLCNLSFQVTLNLSGVKSLVLGHVQDKFHKKRLDAYQNKKEQTSSVESNKTLTEEQNTKETKENNSSTSNSTTDEKENVVINNINQQKLEKPSDKGRKEKRKRAKFDTNDLVDFETIYKSFLQSNPVIKTSKVYIVRQEDGRNHFCTLCNMMIFNPLNANEFRYNLWVHLNEKSHRQKLPNYPKVVKEFEKVMSDISTALPSEYKEDCEYFEVGPVFRFVYCTICEMAVSSNLFRLQNHIKGTDHANQKLALTKKEVKKFPNESLANRTRDAYRKLVVKIDDEFKKDIKYLQIGKMPGYVICSLCTCVIMPTQFYVQSHFETEMHVKNKTQSQVHKNSKFKVSLDDLIKTLPEDLSDYKQMFQENMCGLTCTKCKTSIPATSYDLYSHIMTERQAIL